MNAGAANDKDMQMKEYALALRGQDGMRPEHQWMKAFAVTDGARRTLAWSGETLKQLETHYFGPEVGTLRLFIEERMITGDVRGQWFKLKFPLLNWSPENILRPADPPRSLP